MSRGAMLAWYSMAWHGAAWYGMAWHGMVWHGVVWRGARARARGGPRSVSLPRSLFSPSLSIPLSSSSVSICTYLCLCMYCALPFFRVLRCDRSRSPSRPALTGVKIEPLWRASDSPYVATSRIDHPSQSMLTTSGSVWLRSMILKFARLLKRIGAPRFENMYKCVNFKALFASSVLTF